MQRIDINPKVWGPSAWVFLDAILDSFPPYAAFEDQIWMIDFLTVLGDALPCDKCRKNYKAFASTRPIANSVAGREQAKQWLQSYKQWSQHR